MSMTEFCEQDLPRHGVTHRRAARLRGDSHQARLAPGGEFPLKECLRIVLDEEWEHRLYAERDLTSLEKKN